MRFAVILSFFAFTFASGCDTGTGKVTVETDNGSGEITGKLNDSGTALLVNMTESYLMLKETLISGSIDGIAANAEKLKAQTGTLQAILLADSLYNGWAQQQLDTIIVYNDKIAAVNDPTAETQRILFRPVSDAMYDLLQKAEVTNVRLYRQYCPMAMDNKGAYWISAETNIRNPYFGKKMLECGELTDSL